MPHSCIGNSFVSLAKQLEMINDGHPPMSPAIARRLMTFFQKQATPDPAGIGLSARETDILTAIAKGMRNQEVAETLELSFHTVSTYIRDLYSKLNINNRAQAALEAQRRGLL